MREGIINAASLALVAFSGYGAGVMLGCAWVVARALVRMWTGAAL
jgi:hypothetical protein